MMKKSYFKIRPAFKRMIIIILLLPIITLGLFLFYGIYQMNFAPYWGKKFSKDEWAYFSKSPAQRCAMYFDLKWRILNSGLTKIQVADLLGKPTQIRSFNNPSDQYAYDMDYCSNGGSFLVVTFNEQEQLNSVELGYK